MIKKDSIKNLENVASKIRKGIIEILEPKESHHIGCSLSIVEILTCLYFNVLEINPKKPSDLNRDIFILSKGHAAAALYVTLAEKGFFDKAVLKGYDRNGGMLPEHVVTSVKGIEVSTGSLGHGLPIGLGFAKAALSDNRKNKVYILLSDGEFNEGSNWEAIMFAGHHKLHNLTAIVDNNGFQGYSRIENVIDLSPIFKKISSFGWNVYYTDGHNFKSLQKAFVKSNKSNKPSFIFAYTVKGKGIPYFEGKFESHYLSISAEEKQQILTELNKYL